MTGTLVNYYFHCKRQCYLFGNRINMEDNSERVQIGKALHEEKATAYKDTEIIIDNIRLDRMTAEYLTEIKKSDADREASRWQLIYYLWVLKNKGIYRKGKLEYIEKHNKDIEREIIVLNDSIENQLKEVIGEINELLDKEEVPEVIDGKGCKKCAYYDYCYI